MKCSRCPNEGRYAVPTGELVCALCAMGEPRAVRVSDHPGLKQEVERARRKIEREELVQRTGLESWIRMFLRDDGL